MAVSLRWLALLTVVALLHVGTIVAHGATCASTSEEFIHRYITIPQKPLNTVLVQRFVGPELSISCLSVNTAAGPSCAQAAVPTLCYRRAADTLAALTCESLEEYLGDSNKKLTRGDRDGDDMVWVIKLDTSSQPATCFARTEEVRLLAFVRGGYESSVALFVILLIVVIIVLLVAFILIAFACWQRGQQMDGAGAVAAAGPKMNYLGSQINAAEPSVLQQNVTKVLLPVRASGGVEDLATYYDKIMNDPNYDPTRDGALINLDQSRGPMGVKRIMRASPPRPGDGVDDGQLRQHEEIRRRLEHRAIARRRGGSHRSAYGGEDGAFDDVFGSGGGRRGGGGGDGGDYSDDEYDDDYYNNPRNLLDINDPNGGEIVYDAAGNPIGRRRRRQPSRRSRGGRRDGYPDESLFPTQSGWQTFGGNGDDDDDDEEVAYDAAGNPIPGSPRCRRGGAGPNAPGAGMGADGPNVKFIPQWMYGNFGRGGVIPELEETDGMGPDGTARGPNGAPLMHTNGGADPNDPHHQSQRFHKPLPIAYNPSTNVGAPTPVRQPSYGRDALGASPRGNNVRKGVVGGRTPGASRPTANPNGGGNDGLGGPNDGPTANRRSGSRPYDPNGQQGLVSTPRGGAGGGPQQYGGNNNNNGGQYPSGNGSFGGRPPMGAYQYPHDGEAFQRGDAKVHSGKLSLDATRYADGSMGPSATAGGEGGAGGVGPHRRTASGNGMGGAADSSGVGPNGGPATGEYVCNDCGQYVTRGAATSTFCEATGNRHF